MRNEKGQFKKTNGGQVYKHQQHKGKVMGEHKKVMCIALGIANMPKPFVVHHLDGNKLNNDIDNLAIVTVTAHNRIHRHESWNKGITKESSEKWRITHEKAQQKRFQTFLPLFKMTYELRSSGKSWKEVAGELNITTRQAMERFNRYKEYLKTTNTN